MNGVTKNKKFAVLAVVAIGLAVATGALVWFVSPDPATGGAPATDLRTGSNLVEMGAPSPAVAVNSDPAAAADQPQFEVPASGSEAQQLAAEALRDDASADQRKAAVSALADLGGVEAVDALLSVANRTFANEQTSAFAHHLAQAIAGLSTPEAVERMGLILTDGNPDFPDFADLPVALQDAIRSGLRKSPDAELVAKTLVGQHSSDITQLARSRIQMLEHPETTARLAQMAFREGNTPLFQERMAMLETTRDPRVYDASVRLARANLLSASDVQSLIYNWALNSSELIDSGRVLAHLRAPDLPLSDRSVAAFALAGYASSSESARSTVREALGEILAQPTLDLTLRDDILRAQAMMDDAR